MKLLRMMLGILGVGLLFEFDASSFLLPVLDKYMLFAVSQLVLTNGWLRSFLHTSGF